MKILLIISTILSFSACKQVEVNLLCSEEKDNRFDEVYLIEKAPKSKDDLQKFIYEYNSDMDTLKQYGTRLFLKEHQNYMFDYIFNETIDYSKNGCKEINNMDFLCKISKYRYASKQDTVVYHFFD